MIDDVELGIENMQDRVPRLCDLTPEEMEFEIQGIDDRKLSVFFSHAKNKKNRYIDSAKRIQEVTLIVKKYELTKNGLSPEILKNMLEDMGPTFVKIGQIMSKRTDILPKAYCKELAKLCEESKPLPFEEVKKVIEEQLCAPIDELFASFQEKPLGSASIGQVHRAKLKSGKEVVVKIQRPGIDVIMEHDIMLLRKLIRPLKLAPSVGAVDFNGLLEELWKVTQQELNYFIEAINTMRFAQLNQQVEGISCPNIETEYTTSKVMTMEYIPGYSILDLEKMKQSGISPKELGKRMVQNYLKQILDDGFFHADPHQGNIMVRGNDIVWIDMGMMGTLTRQERSTIKQGVISIVKRDNQGMIRALISLGAAKGELNYSKLYTDIDLLMDRYYSIDLGDTNMGTMMEDIIKAMNDNDIVLPSCVSMLARGLITIEGVLTGLDPEMSIVTIAKTYVRDEMIKNHQLIQNMKTDVMNLVSSTEKAMEIPELASDLIKNTLRGQIRINMGLEGSKSLMDDFHKVMNELIVCIITAALLVASSLICTTDMEPKLLGIPALGFMGYVLALALGIYLIFDINIKNR